MTSETRVPGVAEACAPDGSREVAGQLPARPPAEGLLWLLAGLVVAVLLTWPLVGHLSSQVGQDTADPLSEAWEVAWSGHALLTQPLRLYSANAFWPEGPSLAFSDAQIGYLPASLIGSGHVAALIRYNLLFLLAYGLAFAGAALLARELGVRRSAAAVAAAAFAWAPWRTSHNGHLNILGTGGVPLSLYLLVSGYRRGRPGQVVAGWLVAAWQVSLGFALGIWFCYLLAALAAAAAVSWLRCGRPALPPPLVRATVIGAGAFLFLVALLLAPYALVRARYPDAVRTLADIDLYSPPVRGLLAASGEARYWGARTAFVRDTLPWPPEQVLFPGLLVLVLAVAGLTSSRATRRVRTVLAVTTLVAVVLSLGTAWGPSRPLYVLLFDNAPGWSSVRTPGRFALFWSLGLALLAALGAERAARAVARGRSVVPAAAVGLVLALVVLGEGAPRLPLADVPPPPPGLSAVPGPLVQLPASATADNTYAYWSTDGWTPLANGSTSYLPPPLAQVRSMESFPDLATVAELRARGYRNVVVHTDLVPGTPWEGVGTRSVAGLGVTVRTQGTLLVFDLVP